MLEFYQDNYRAYHERTFYIDPSSFLSPLVKCLSPGSRILDVGCGSGRDLLWMKKRGFDVIGFEQSPGLAKLARENVGCEIIEGDFETYDFSAILVDAVILVGALVHIPYKRFSEVFGNITSALPEHGNVLITLKEGSGSRTDSESRIFYLWQDDEARKLFDSLGFKIHEFLKSISKTSSGEVWLTYIIDKMG